MNIEHDRTINERVIRIAMTTDDVKQAIVDYAMRDPALTPSLDAHRRVSAKVDLEVGLLGDLSRTTVTITIEMGAAEVAS